MEDGLHHPGIMNTHSEGCMPNVRTIDPAAAHPSHRRLSQSFARLESIQRQRDLSGDPLLEKATEDHIVWRELLELEFQSADDKIG